MKEADTVYLVCKADGVDEVFWHKEDADHHAKMIKNRGDSAVVVEKKVNGL